MKKNYTLDFSEIDFVGNCVEPQKERFNYWCSKKCDLYDAIDHNAYHYSYRIVEHLLFYADIDFYNSDKIKEIKTTLNFLKSTINRLIKK